MDDFSQSFSIEIRQYLGLLRRWAWLLGLLAILGGVLTYFYSVRQPKIYRASATVLIDNPQVTGDQYYNIYYSDRLAATYSQMIVQQPTLEGVIEELGLELSVGQLQGMLQVETVPDTQLLVISAEDTNPDRAAAIVNSIGSVFAETNAELQASRYRQTKDSLEAQMIAMDQQIAETNQALEKIKTPSLDNTEMEIRKVQLDTYREIYQALLTQIVESETQNIDEDMELTENGVLDEKVTPIDEQIVQIETMISEIAGQIEELGWNRGAEYDLLNTKLNAYKNLYEQLLEEILIQDDSYLESSDNKTIEIDRLTDQLEITGQRIQELTSQINETGGSVDGGMERDRLEANLALYRQTYANLVRSYEEVRLAEIQNSTQVELVQPATTPSFPIRPNMQQNTLLGVVLGLMVGAGGAFLIELLDDTIKGPGDIFKHLKLPVLGYIDRIEGGTTYPIAAEEPRSPQAESFRSLRTNIQYASVDRPLFTLMVTSPTPEDGKSTIVANLSVVLAQNKYRVNIIDADMRRPDQHRIFDLSNRRGLSDALINPLINMNGSFKETATENLTVLTTGDLPPNPSELVASDRMMQLIQDLQESVDIVIIDSPPVMAVTDPVVLSPRVDGVVIVVRPGITKLAATIHTVEQLRQVGANILGVILNDVEDKGKRYSEYYKGYYTQYGKYYEYTSGVKKKK